jgi:hypothetical protein
LFNNRIINLNTKKMKNFLTLVLNVIIGTYYYSQTITMDASCPNKEGVYSYAGDVSGKPSYMINSDGCSEFNVSLECDAAFVSDQYYIRWNGNNWEWVASNQSTCTWTFTECLPSGGGNPNVVLARNYEDTPFPPHLSWNVLNGNCMPKIIDGYSCNIKDQDLLSCLYNNTIRLNSQKGLNYYLKNNLDQIVDGPIAGTDLLISLNTGVYTSGQSFTVYASSITDSANCNMELSEVITATSNSFQFLGSGTSIDPYQISTLEHLRAISESYCLWDKYFIQTANIDATSTSTWNVGDHDNDNNTPDVAMGFSSIGKSPYSSEGYFTGNYNGNNFIISNLYINRPLEQMTGLFGYQTGEINSTHLRGGSFKGDYAVGGLVSFNSGAILYCSSSVNVTGEYEVGGLAGRNNGTISNSYATGSVTGGENVGGLVGHNYFSTITNCYSSGLVTGDANVGGFLGSWYPGPVTNCFWNTETSSQNASVAGTGIDIDDMKDQTTFTAGTWDFTTIWKMGNDCNNNSYPILFNEQIKTNPTISVTSLNARCGAGSLTLEVNASAGNINWYFSQNGTFLLQSGANYTTPNLTSSRFYYVEADDNGCKSVARTSVRASIENCVTEVSSIFCNTTISALDDKLTINKIKDATNYQYEAYDGVNTLSFTKGSGNAGFKMANFASVKYQTTYQVRVRAYVYGNWEDWSAYCNITTPKSKVKDNFCGQTVASLNTFLSIYPVANAINYEYEAFDGTNTLTFQKGNGELTFRMSLFPAAQNNKSYQVRVRPYVNNVWGNWSDYCEINTPTLREGSAENNQIMEDVEAQNFELQIYPNPNNGTFTISSELEGRFQITNELGQLVKTIELTKNKNQDGAAFQNLEMRLKPGVYFVSGFVNNEIITKKIVVQ